MSQSKPAHQWIQCWCGINHATNGEDRCDAEIVIDTASCDHVVGHSGQHRFMGIDAEAGRAVQDDGLPTVEALAQALDHVWAMGWIAMPDHETEQIARALLDTLRATPLVEADYQRFLHPMGQPPEASDE